MGTSHGRILNNKTYFATFNKWFTLGDDLLERAMMIRMDAKRNVADEQRNKVETTIAHTRTQDLLADIWFNLGQVNWTREVEHIRHQKFDVWSKVMGASKN
jgi:hypothetical protein